MVPLVDPRCLAELASIPEPLSLAKLEARLEVFVPSGFAVQNKATDTQRHTWMNPPSTGQELLARNSHVQGSDTSWTTAATHLGCGHLFSLDRVWCVCVCVFVCLFVCVWVCVFVCVCVNCESCACVHLYMSICVQFCIVTFEISF